MLSEKYPQFQKYRGLLFFLVLASLAFSMKLNSLFIILLVLQWLLMVPLAEKKENLRRNWKLIALFGGYFLLFAISILYSENTSSAWKDIESKLSLLLIPLSILGQKRLEVKEQAVLLKLYVWFLVGVGVFLIGKSLFLAGGLLTNQEFSALIGVHASYLSLYMAAALFITIQSLTHKSQIKLNTIIALFLAFISVVLAARMVTIATFLSLFTWFAVVHFTWKRLLTMIVIFIGVVFAISSIDSVKSRFQEGLIGEQVEFGNVDDSVKVKTYGGKAIRVAIWQCAQEVVKDNWLMGVGAGDVHKSLQASYKRNEFQLAWQYNNFNSHNLFIETIIAVGVLGVVVLITLFYLLFFSAIKNRNMLLFCFTTLFFMFSLIESAFNVQKGIVFLVAISCLLFSTREEVDKS